LRLCRGEWPYEAGLQKLYLGIVDTMDCTH
jgi:hypothetical protein